MDPLVSSTMRKFMPGKWVQGFRSANEARLQGGSNGVTALGSQEGIREYVRTQTHTPVE